MAYVVAKPGGRYEIRQSSMSPKGPRSRTLATFRRLTPGVFARARERAAGSLDFAELRRAARSAGAPVVRTGADEAAIALAARLAEGDGLSPSARRIVADSLGVAMRHNLTDAERAAVPWLAKTPAERGEALWDLLLLADRLPVPGRADRPRFPGIRTVR